MKTAVIKTGGKQYLVQEGDVLKVEKLNAKEGEKVVFDDVLLVFDEKDISVGSPTVEGAKVEAEVLEQGRDKKLHVIRFRAKSRYFRKYGHRQPYSRVKISAIK